MNKQTLIQTLGLSALIATGVIVTANMNINLQHVGIALACAAAGLILAFAALEPRRRSL